MGRPTAYLHGEKEFAWCGRERSSSHSVRIFSQKLKIWRGVKSETTSTLRDRTAWKKRTFSKIVRVSVGYPVCWKQTTSGFYAISKWKLMFTKKEARFLTTQSMASSKRWLQGPTWMLCDLKAVDDSNTQPHVLYILMNAIIKSVSEVNYLLGPQM